MVSNEQLILMAFFANFKFGGALFSRKGTIHLFDQAKLYPRFRNFTTHMTLLCTTYVYAFSDKLFS